MSGNQAVEAPSTELSKERSSGNFAMLVRWLIAVAAFVAFGFGVAIVCHRYHYWAEVVNSFRLQVSLVILMLGLMLWYSKFRAWGLIQVAFALYLLFPILSALRPATQSEPGPRKLNLLSFNVLGSNVEQEATVEMLENSGADILVVLEYENKWVDSLDSIQNMYAYSILEPRWHGFGLAVYSRYPIEPKVHQLTDRETDNVFAVAVVDVQGQKFAICACHFLAPMSASKMRIRNDQIVEAAKIIETIREEDGLPVILVGDFNCVPWSSYLNEIEDRAGLRDSRQGYLYHRSWPSSNAILSTPIDNAFVSPEIHIHRSTILTTTNSDHYPLSLEFSVSESGPASESP